ncbi:hypothetical protein D3C75_1113260 [compost metagenome]
MVDARRTQGAELGRQRLAAAAETEAPALQRFVGVVRQVQVDEAAVGLVARHRAPGGDPLPVVVRCAGVGQAAVQVAADPCRALLGQAGYQQR